MNPACCVMRPKLERSTALPTDDPLNFAVFVRLRISNRICADCWFLPNRVSFVMHEIDVLPELVARVADRARRVAVLSGAGIRESAPA